MERVALFSSPAFGQDFYGGCGTIWTAEMEILARRETLPNSETRYESIGWLGFRGAHMEILA
jgi:hypothetical protein